MNSIRETDPYRLVDKLDLEKIHKYMESVNWTWFSMSGDRVPTIRELRDTAIELMRDVIKSDLDNTQVSTGGLVACKFTFDDKGPCYDIMFCLEHQSNY